MLSFLTTVQNFKNAIQYKSYNKYTHWLKRFPSLAFKKEGKDPKYNLYILTIEFIYAKILIPPKKS